jgi:hypothetical protein
MPTKKSRSLYFVGLAGLYETVWNLGVVAGAGLEQILTSLVNKGSLVIEFSKCPAECPN